MKRKIAFVAISTFMVLGLLANAEDARADDTLYVIDCDCDPTIRDEAELEISTQLSTHSQEFGSAGGFENGDEVIVRNGGTLARWKITIPPGSWSNNSSAGFGCDTNFDTCVDLTGTNIGLPFVPHPAQHGVPPQPMGSAEWDYCIGLSAFYNISFWPAPGTVLPVTLDVDIKIGSTWYPFWEGGQSSVAYTCNVNRLFRVRAINGVGASSWGYWWANHNCSWGGDPD